MLKVKAIDHLNFEVADLERSKNFYQKILGLEVKEEGKSQVTGAKFAIVGLSGKIMLCIYERQDGKPAPMEGFNHFGIEIDDFEAGLAFIKEQGVKITYDLIDWGKSRSFYIQDPDGIEIDISEKFGGAL